MITICVWYRRFIHCTIFCIPFHKNILGGVITSPTYRYLVDIYFCCNKHIWYRCFDLQHTRLMFYCRVSALVDIMEWGKNKWSCIMIWPVIIGDKHWVLALHTGFDFSFYGLNLYYFLSGWRLFILCRHLIHKTPYYIFIFYSLYYLLYVNWKAL